MEAPTITVQQKQQGDLIQYHVSNSWWGWGHVIIDPSRGMVLCYTDYGNYNFAWSHPGGDLFAFLPQLSYDYAMGKFLGSKSETDVERSVKNMRRHILEYRRDDCYTAEEAREMWDAVKEGEQEYGYSGAGFSHFMSGSAFAEHSQEWYDRLVYTHPSDSKGFWEHIWQPLMEHIKQSNAQPV